MEKERKKYLHICTIDKGGAYNGAKRLNEMLTEHGIESKIIVRSKTDNSSLAICAFDSRFQEIISKAYYGCMICGCLQEDVLLTEDAVVS